MTRAAAKIQLIEDAQAERAAPEKLLATLTPGQMTRAKAADDWSAKDVLAHLIEWEGMVVKWHETGAKVKIPAVPSEEYNWGQLPQLNHAIHLKHRDRSLEDIQKEFISSYKKIMKLIESIPRKNSSPAVNTRGRGTTRPRHISPQPPAVPTVGRGEGFGRRKNNNWRLESGNENPGSEKTVQVFVPTAGEED